MSADGDGGFPVVQSSKHGGVHEICDNQVTHWKAGPEITDDSLEPANAGRPGVAGILFVVDGEFKKQQIDWAQGDDVSFQTESSRG